VERSRECTLGGAAVESVREAGAIAALTEEVRS
jgi:hypothetical protein